MIRFPPKNPDERIMLTADFTDLAPDGASLVSVVTVVTDSKSKDGSPSAIKDGSPFCTGFLAYQWTVGGVVGADYVIQFKGTFSDGSIMIGSTGMACQVIL